MNLTTQQNTVYSPIYLPKGTKKLNINENGLFDSIHLDEPRVIIQTDDYLELIQEDELELFGIHFRFSDDLWDFSKNSEEFKNVFTYKYNFSSLISDEHKTICKLFILNALLEYGLDRPFIYKCLMYAIDFLNYLNKEYLTIEDLDTHHLDLYFEAQTVSARTKSKKKCDIRKIIEFYCTVTDKMVNSEILSYLEDMDNLKVKAQLIQNKTKLLPHSIMKPLIQLLYEGYKNPRYSRTFRRYLALLYIESQCGIRPGELLMLSKDCIIKQNALGKTLYQL